MTATGAMVTAMTVTVAPLARTMAVAILVAALTGGNQRAIEVCPHEDLGVLPRGAQDDVDAVGLKDADRTGTHPRGDHHVHTLLRQPRRAGLRGRGLEPGCR